MFQDYKQRFLVKFWSRMPAIIALVMAAYYFSLTGTYATKQY